MEGIDSRTCFGRMTLKQGALIIACIGLIIEVITALGALLCAVFIAQDSKTLIFLIVSIVAAINVPFEALLIYGIVKDKWRLINIWRIKTITMFLALLLLQLPIFYLYIRGNPVMNLFIILACVFLLGFQLYVIQPYYKYLHTRPVIKATPVPLSDYNHMDVD